MWLWLTALGVVVAFALGWVMSTRRDHSTVPEPEVVRLSAYSPGHPSVNDVLEALHLGIAISGPDGVGEFRNSAAEAMSGTPAGAVLDDAIARHLGRGLVGIQSDEVIESSGPPRASFVVRSSPLPGGGSVSFVEDTSERRRIDQVRTDFVANVSHELKTPIGALSVLAETLQGESDPATVDRLAGRMLAEAERASNTIDDLMELSRIELGGDAVVERVQVGDVVRGAVDRVLELAAMRDISITTDHSDDVAVKLAVNGDRRQLVSAVGNLVENAVKYSEHGASVCVRTRQDADAVEIEVVDRGVGIPADDVGRVFERFYRVDQARSRATGGTGLGLSIVRHIVTNHGGSVGVSSVEGEGSTFRVRLPTVAQPTADEMTQASGSVA